MKRALITIIQILVTISILYWVFRDPGKRAQMLAALQQADNMWILIGMAVQALALLFAAVRWHVLLKAQEIAIGWGRTLRLFMVGLFFNLFMLGATGGDVIKIYYLLKETKGRGTAAFLTVVMDRLIGLVAIICVAAFFIAYRYDALMSPAAGDRAWFTSFLVIFAVSLGGIVFSLIVAGFDLADKLPRWMPLKDKFVELTAAYKSYGKKWKATLAAFLLSAASHVGFFTVFYCAARAFHAQKYLSHPDDLLIDIFSVIPIVNTIAAMPISVAGVGIREKSCQDLLYHVYGIPEHVGVLISVLGFFFLVAWCLVGGLCYLFYRPSTGGHVRLKDISKEVHHLEDEISHHEK